jgi:hypothetical protein
VALCRPRRTIVTPAVSIATLSFWMFSPTYLQATALRTEDRQLEHLVLSQCSNAIFSWSKGRGPYQLTKDDLPAE